MKKLATLITILTIATFVYAQTPAIVFLRDGSQMEGLVNEPKFNAKSVKFRTDRQAKSQKIKTEDIQMIGFIFEDGVVEVEPVQVNISPAAGLFKRQRPIFLSVVERGPVTLYYIQVTEITNSSVRVIDTYYVQTDKNSKALNTFYNQRGQIGDPFRKNVGPKTFADNPEIVEKIKKKEEGYTHKDIVKIVREYNAVKSEK